MRCPALRYRPVVGPPPLPHQIEVLRSTLESVTLAAADGGTAPLVVFGLDGVLYDHRFRTAAILRELGASLDERLPEAGALGGVDVADVGDVVDDTLATLGVRAPDRVLDLRNEWQERFFSDRYLRHDRAAPGAVEYVGALYEAGAAIVYLSARDRLGMLLGTVGALRDDGFPVAEPGVQLVLKPEATLSDEAFQRSALPQLVRMGKVAAVFDADPTVCDLARALFPDARVCLVALTAFRVPTPDSGVEVVGDFRVRG